MSRRIKFQHFHVFINVGQPTVGRKIFNLQDLLAPNESGTVIIH